MNNKKIKIKKKKKSLLKIRRSLYIDKSILIKQEDIAMINIHVAKNIV
jgi:hypothetical protein